MCRPFLYTKEKDFPMRLIIAEKPSVAKEIAHTINKNSEKKDGYLDTGNDLVSWAQGHLVDLQTPNEYTAHPEWAKWDPALLPLIPEEWEWAVSGSRGAAARFHTLEQLMNRNDVTELVNACDPDREGEAIFRRITTHAHNTKPVKRLWGASLDDDAIREALAHMKPSSEYDGLGAAADARAKADWLVGMNASRAYSLAYNQRMSVGRVQTPTLALIVHRDQQITSHTATPFWKIIAHVAGEPQWTLVSEKIDSPSHAETLQQEIAQLRNLTIETVEKKTVKTKPPTLYDLTSLQRDMNTLHGMSASQTLETLQHLYDEKLASYPRTDSQYITHDDLTMFTQLMESEILTAACPANVRSRKNLDQVVNDSKVAGHTAILITKNLTEEKLSTLSSDEQKLARQIMLRMWQAVSPSWVHEKTSVSTTVSDITFGAHSDVTIDAGWKTIDTTKVNENQEDDDKTETLPTNLTEGMSLTIITTEMSEGKTAPPKPYTEASLLAAMEHASRFLDDKNLKHALDDDHSHSGGIGTPATRAEIIEKLVKSKLITRSGKKLASTIDGQKLIAVVSPRLASVELTADMEARLTDIEHGELNEDAFMRAIIDYTRLIPEETRKNFQPDLQHTRETTIVGICPRCGKNVIQTGSMWQCETNRSQKQTDGTYQQTAGCGYKIWPKLAGKKLTTTIIQKVLTNSRPLIQGFTSKSGKKFSAHLIIDNDRGVSFDFKK